MKGFFMKLRERLNATSEDYDVPEEADEGYIELSTESTPGHNAKINVRPFVLEGFDDIKRILDAVREGYSIAMVNIKPLRDKDIVELKRAISKIKKTSEAIDGDIAGFGEDWICICPSFARVFREPKLPKGGSKMGRGMVDEEERTNSNFETY